MYKPAQHLALKTLNNNDHRTANLADSLVNKVANKGVNRLVNKVLYDRCILCQ